MHLPAALRANRGLKILSAALALLLWFFVHGAKIVEREHRIPITYANLPDSLMFLEPPPREMRVLLSGPAQDLALRLRVLRDVAARIDLSNASAVLDRVVPSLSDIGAPRSKRISVVRVLSPSVIPLRLAARAERELPVRVVFRGEQAAGWCLADSPHAEPARVVCSGPAILLRDLGAMPTRPLVLPERHGRFTLAVELASDDERLSCRPPRVQVTFETQRLRNRSLPDAPLVVVPPAAGGLWAAIDVDKASLTLAGPESLIEALLPDDVGLFIDASRLAPGRHDSVPVIAQFPSWARLVRLEPQSIGVTVHHDRGRRASRGERPAGSLPQLP